MPDAIVMHQPAGSVIIRFCGPSVVMGSQPRAPVVLASKPKTIVVTVGHQGPPGRDAAAVTGALREENRLSEFASDPQAQQDAQHNLGLGVEDPLAYYILAKS